MAGPSRPSRLPLIVVFMVVSNSCTPNPGKLVTSVPGRRATDASAVVPPGAFFYGVPQNTAPVKSQK
jgi:hypothetical protein